MVNESALQQLQLSKAQALTETANWSQFNQRSARGNEVVAHTKHLPQRIGA